MAISEPRERASQKVVVLLLTLTMVPILVTLIAEINKAFLVWHIRIVDFLDLVLLAPFYTVLLYQLHRNLVNEQRNKWQAFLSFTLIVWFLYGHAIHLTANAVNTYSTEVHDYLDRIPADTYALLYFFDEQLGHWIMYCALFLLLGLWTWMEKGSALPSLSCFLLGLTIAAGSLEGVAIGVAFVESSQPILGYLLSGLLLSWVAFRSAGILQPADFRARLSSRPLTIFALCLAVLVPVTETVYSLVMGGFIQPSQLMLGR